ncbi:MAG: sulfite exporter TauE/SafE family protein [Alphaproteobacteria bacterium]|nr:sulfite exporter TauE/SafE family protein [Alphaproteobacteria bacterium]
MADFSSVGALTAFGAGIISFLSPCVLPLVPGYVSYIAGESAVQDSQEAPDYRMFRALGLSACFMLGFTTVFVIFGASATALGQLLLRYREEENIVGGAIVTLFGLLITGLVRVPWLDRDFRWHSTLKGGHPVGAYTLGLGFAFGWTPCIGPVLGAILTMSAVSTSVSAGIVLLTVYSLGLGVPFLASAAFTDRLTAQMKRMRRAGRLLQIAAGCVMVAMGIAIMTGELTTFSYWLLDTFPVLSRIG